MPQLLNINVASLRFDIYSIGSTQICFAFFIANPIFSNVCKHLQKEFPKTLSYNRFVELQQRVVMPLVIFLKACRMGKCSGISFIDSTTLKVCHIKIERQNRVFKGIAVKGKGTLDWFFGFKLHLIINDKGEIISFVITQGNVDDREPLKMESFIRTVSGKLYGDRGYISKELATLLFWDGINLVYKMRNNMKGGEIPFQDKLILRKRAVTEHFKPVELYQSFKTLVKLLFIRLEL